MFKIGDTVIKNPSKFSVEHYMLTDSTRLANGDMTMDFIALKRKFEFSYNALESKQLAIILKAIWEDIATNHSCFLNLTIPTETGTEVIVVYPGSIPTNLHRADSLNWVWKDVTFSLIER